MINGGIVGSFYGNVTLLGTTFDAVGAAAPRPAFAFAEGDAVVLFAEEDDSEAPRSAARLSAEVGCIAFSVGIHDDDIFLFEVHDRGRSVTGGAVPDPADYFGIDPEMLADIDESTLDGMDAAAPSALSGPPDPVSLVRALGRGDVEAVRAALEGAFVFASERHEAVVAALGLPGGAVGWGYRYLSNDGDGYAGPPLSTL